MRYSTIISTIIKTRLFHLDKMLFSNSNIIYFRMMYCILIFSHPGFDGISYFVFWVPWYFYLSFFSFSQHCVFERDKVILQNVAQFLIVFLIQFNSGIIGKNTTLSSQILRAILKSFCLIIGDVDCLGDNFRSHS